MTDTGTDLPTQPAARPRTDLPPSWSERDSLATFLDYVRDTARAKCAGVSAEDARAAPLPGSPLMTMCGLISHLYWVEYSWFEVVFLGKEDEGPWTDEDPDREMRIALDVPLADLLRQYEEQSARHREFVAARDLDEKAVRPVRDGQHVTLRWIVLHLIEETARHNGHLDLLRETVDGVTGT
ncbi:DinB family protein [Streptomyces sp. NPDC007088]|uniref:DinB family protein n=1 Tax=Streptomyces sp. NPDC007088 TaxID=3364773 RepID=UPI0036909DEC